MSSAMEIVTGSTGAVHVTPIDDAVRNSNFGYAHQKVVFDYFDNFAITERTANLMRISSGYGMNQGRLFKIDENTYDEVIIDNGAAGYTRSDLICARYTMNNQTGFEDISLVVIKGEPRTDGTYVDPNYETYDINSMGDGIAARVDDFPLYRIKINGLQIAAKDQLFEVLPDGGRVGEIEQRLNANIKTDLASESAGHLDGSENVDIGVKGTLPINHGGTGSTTASGAMKTLIIDNLSADTDAPTDATEFITSESSNGFSTTLKKRTLANLWSYIQSKVKTLLGMGNGTSIPVANGGTGKTSFTAGSVLVGNGTGALNEMGVDTAPSSSGSNKLITSKGVADALGNAGYGDMMKSTYDINNDGIVDKAAKLSTARTLKVNLASTSDVTFDGSANKDIGVKGTLGAGNGGTGYTSLQATRNAMGLGNTTSYLPVANGGTGTNDGTLNGVKLGTSGSGSSKKYGYYDGNTFKSFRQPTGNAVAANVLSGKTFANSSSDSITGTMTNQGAYTASLSNANNDTLMYLRIPTGAYVTAGSSGYPEITVPLRNNVAYSQGVNDAQADHWDMRNVVLKFGGDKGSYSASAEMMIDCTNMVSFTCTAIFDNPAPTTGNYASITWQHEGTVLREEALIANGVYTVPATANYCVIKRIASYGTPPASGSRHEIYAYANYRAKQYPNG